jgi:signal transduction histidine kinase
MLAATIVTVSLVLGAAAVYAPRETVHLTETAQGPEVAAVGVGSYAWASGVRPGALGWLQVGDDPAQSLVYFHIGKSDFGFPPNYQPAHTQDLMLALACALLAVLLLFARLPGGAALLALGTGICLYEFDFQTGLPAAVPLLAFPALAALLTIRVGERRRQRLFDVGGLVVIGALVVVGLVVAQGTIDVPWREAWRWPTFVGVALASVGGLIAFAIRYRALPIGTPGRAIAAAVPLASLSRLVGAEEERSRLAIELHNTFLPRVQTSLESLRHAGSVEAATSQLETIATDLRGAMERRQTVTLEIGGVAAALRSEFESLPGPRVEFFVSGGSNRPPRRIELAAYRVGQAAIDNALRHSGAEKVNVAITSAPENFELSVADDGVGLDELAEHEAQRRGRIGLAQMRLHAELVGATLELSGTRDKGTTVRFRWAA